MSSQPNKTPASLERIFRMRGESAVRIGPYYELYEKKQQLERSCSGSIPRGLGFWNKHPYPQLSESECIDLRLSIAILKAEIKHNEKQS